MLSNPHTQHAKTWPCVNISTAPTTPTFSALDWGVEPQKQQKHHNPRVYPTKTAKTVIEPLVHENQISSQQQHHQYLNKPVEVTGEPPPTQQTKTRKRSLAISLPLPLPASLAQPLLSPTSSSSSPTSPYHTQALKMLAHVQQRQQRIHQDIRNPRPGNLPQLGKYGWKNLERMVVGFPGVWEWLGGVVEFGEGEGEGEEGDGEDEEGGESDKGGKREAEDAEEEEEEGEGDGEGEEAEKGNTWDFE
ncbi:predicted protein [Pyrenophora tritici-repentis Pt-1C-BFP]|uniref:Uncharacterized protein n=2 Tax=Pyrenophora tritici-repentis TaxID=45151 RepID=A0A922N2K8_9PLEO|nr:uncharacterized protein PTRG_04488 [Pyrenophora tritici-repentis Pt-1C-BFP]EDU47395.1 predicted protein [Pyrenophora tritici-repentis Pt-1C-BFP]KAI1508548.1 hypothetical protein Ptr86124_012500 [Pyrenophora tritici-repentis]